MNGRRAILGLLLLCGLLFSAFAASSASANTMRIFTCVSKEGGDYSDQHCEFKAGEPKTGKWGHEKIEDHQSTETSIANAPSTPAKLNITLFGIKVKIECPEVSGEATLMNEAGPPVKVKGEKINITYSGCTAPEPAEQKCKVTGGAMAIKGATLTTEKTGMDVEVKPEAKTLFTFKLEGCKMVALNGEYKVEGTMNAVPEGAFWSYTAESTKNLKFGGSTASFIGKDTIEMKGGGNPISLTTVGTGP